ncbi:MAG: SUMF1/EgtB/PvdO family nonheme iron enzyme [Chloroflexi bacterium]|nr:SUMF1/EgtB/PvdO family nonheme iron enzyme [Chloroflexota bacterium]
MKPNILLLLTAAVCGLTLRAQQFTEENWSLNGFASQSSEANAGTPDRAIDGNTDGNWVANSTTHSGGPAADADAGGPFWEVDLGTPRAVGRIHVWFRTDCCQNRNDDFTMIVLDANRQEVWRRTYPGRPANDVAYNLAPAVTGQIVRFEPQNPPTTSDGYFSLAEVQVIAPYQNVTIIVTQQPIEINVTEGRLATFGPVAAQVVGAPQDRLTYQWQKNGVDIPGAIGPSYTTPVLQTLGDHNTEYGVRFLVSGLSVASAKAKLLVAKDTVPPTIDSFSLAGGATLEATVKFSEVMDTALAQHAANYNFGAGVTVTKAVASGVLFDPADQHPYQNVVLSVVGLAQNVLYSVTVSGVKDLGGNPLASVTFTGTTPFFEVNLAQSGTATQSSTAPGGEAAHANDGNTNQSWSGGSVTLNETVEDPGWWEVDLGGSKPIGRVKVWFRVLDAGECQALFNSCTVRNDDFTLSILDASRNVVWKITYPGRPPLQVAYNLPSGVAGQYVRFESQTPLTTSDGYFSLAEVQAIAPYENVTLAITKDLANAVMVTENRRALLGPVAATLTGAAGAPADVLQYQWQLNGVDILGANLASYQTPPLALGDNGARYRCRFLISGAVLASTEATVTVEKDTVPPAIKSVAGGFSYTDITVIFSEAVSETTAGNLANYGLSGGLVLSEAFVLTPTSVRLTTTPQTPGTKYTLTVNGIRDLASGGGNLIAANSKMDFTAPQTEANRFVVVGEPGNPKDTQWNTARGAVSYVYEISKYKVRNSEYAAFLNAKAKSDPNSLWDGGGEILREGEDGSYTYTVLEGRENRPVRWVAAVDAMRMANWLSNGGTEESDTETGSYTFTGYDVVSKRNPNADYFLPSNDEWYKAAYYDPNKNGAGAGGYWQYPVKTDDPAKLVAELPPGGPFSVNFNSVNSADGGTTDVGAYTAASSYYGTFDQAGNTWEWNEPQDPATKVTSRMSGSWANAINRLSANTIASNGINNSGQSEHQGFRLARAHRVRLQFVAVGNPGNPKDTVWNTARGQVNYAYQIGKYKISNAEYVVFLNAKAKSDPNSLWSGGDEILREGEDGSYTYTVLAGRENRPVRWVAAVDAMRMANWLSNGATETSDTETGSYTFTGYDVVSRRNPTARYVLPSNDEWYKAAYYDPTKNGTGGYWQYPVKTDDPAKLVAELPPGGPFSVNFNSVNSADGGTTDVGAYTAASSYYGTFDQAGNTWEWNEPQDPTTKVTSRMSGSWANAINRLSANTIASNGINNSGQSEHQGFRLALVPPPVLGPKLTIENLTATTARITWTGTGTLESAPTVQGQWTPVEGNPASPYLVNPTGAAKYYRVRQ